MRRFSGMKPTTFPAKKKHAKHVAITDNIFIKSIVNELNHAELSEMLCLAHIRNAIDNACGYVIYPSLADMGYRHMYEYEGVNPTDDEDAYSYGKLLSETPEDTYAILESGKVIRIYTM